eukprot:s455_g7.t1
MEEASHPPLAQRTVALTSHLGALLDLHGELHTEIRLLEEQRVLFPEVHEALTAATQAILAAVSQIRDRRDDMAAVVERQQRRLIGASRSIEPLPSLTTQNLQQHNQCREEHPDENEDYQATSETYHETPMLAIVPAPCARARISSTSISGIQEFQSAPELLECGPRPAMTMIERSLLFIARAESAPGGA